MTENLIVGSEGCDIKEILLTIKNTPPKNFSRLADNEWTNLALALKVDQATVKELQRRFQRSDINLGQAIGGVLEEWKDDAGEAASLNVLANALEISKGKAYAESLRLHFRLPCNAAEGNPSIHWNDIPPAFQKRITENFQNFFPTSEFLEFLPNLKAPALINLMTGKKPPIFVHPFPETLRYYISRTLITRNIISKKIFEHDSKDIFLFSQMDPSELSDLAGKSFTGTSSEKLRYSSTVRFLILDRDHHFDKICEKTNHPVHLLRREADGRLRWIRSSGGMDNLQKCVDQVQDKFDEKTFYEHMGSGSSPVLICDSPGMGKSVLLAQIGAALGRQFPHRVVLFIVFSEFIKLVKSTGMSDEVKMIEVALKQLTGEPVHSNTEDTTSVSCELLLDGFDEVDSADQKLAHSILNNISTILKPIRLWVTSRPHQMEELETSLNLLGYNIRPFDQQDQVQFLSSFWSRKDKLDRQKSELFAENCLQSIKCKIDSTSQDIAGIPLQCLLIGEVYEDDAVEYARNEDGPPVIFEIGTITELYQRLITKKIEKYKSLTGKLDENELMRIHARVSVELIFPGKLKALKLRPVRSGFAELLKVGIIVKSSGSYAFLHRTFAEYFVSWFVLDKLGTRKESSLMRRVLVWCLREGQWTGKMNRFFFHSVLEYDEDDSFKFVHPVICYFLNSSIADLTAGNNSLYLCTHLHTEIPELMDKIAIACARADLLQIFKLFHSRYETDKNFTSAVFTQDLLLHSIERSSLELVKPIVFQLEKQDRFSIEVQGTALRTAVMFGKFPIVEYLVKEKQACGIVEDLNYGAGRLVKHCIANSLHSSDEDMIENKIQVLRMLTQINGSLLDTKVDGSPPLLFKHVHVKLLMELVRLGADVLAEDKQKYTVLHLTKDRELSSSDYHSLIMSIPDHSLRQLVHRNVGGRTTLTSSLAYIDPIPETLDVFNRMGADFNHIDSEGYSVLEFSVRCGRSAVTIRKIIQHGDIKKLGRKKFSIMWFIRPIQRTNLLHIAAECGNMEAVRVLVDEYGMDVNSGDNHGLTPLDRLIESNENGDRYSTGLALNERGGRFKYDKALINAAAKHNVQSARFLISFGVDVNESDQQGNTALHKSLEPKRGYSPAEFTIAQLLVQSGADVTALNKMGFTPFHTALKNEDLDFKTFLLLKSKTDETSALCKLAIKFALRGKDNDEFDEEGFISVLNNVSKKQNVCLIESDGNFAAHAAARWGHLIALQLLVGKGADINVKNKLGETPLHVAARYNPNGYMIMIKYLIEHGADAYTKDNEDRTFLHRFILTRPSPASFHLMVEYLIQAGIRNLFKVSGGGCREYYEGNCGAFPLQLAVGYLEPEIKTLKLFQLHVDFNATDQLGHSILVNAVQGDRGLEFISTLVNRFKVNWRIIDKCGWSILHHAASVYGSNSVDYLKFFLKLRGLNVNGINDVGKTALFCAVIRNDTKNVLESCKLLVAHGADINIRSKAGVTPIALVEWKYKGAGGDWSDDDDKTMLVELLRPPQHQER